MWRHRRRVATPWATPWRIWLALGGICVLLTTACAHELSVAGAPCGPSSTGAGQPAELLARGRAALESGAFDVALCTFDALARAEPLMADHAARWQAEALLQSGRRQEALRHAVAAQQDTAKRSAPVRRALSRIEAQARLALGDGAGARAIWRRLTATERTDDARAALLARRAASHEADGDLTAAAAHWLELFRHYGATPAGAGADAALDRLVARGVPDRRGEPTVQDARCQTLARARRNVAALESCERAFELAREPEARARLARKRADLLFRLRRYPDATRAYAALEASRSADFWRARSLARAGQVEAAIALFEKLAKASDALAWRSRFLAATLLEEDTAKRARAHFRLLAARAPDLEQRLEARWRLGWDDYRAGHFEAAARHFDQLARIEPDTPEGLRGRYWAARSRAATTAEGAAHSRSALAALAEEHAFSYYGFRAAAGVLAHPATPVDRAEPLPELAHPGQPVDRPKRLSEGLAPLAYPVDRAEPLPELSRGAGPVDRSAPLTGALPARVLTRARILAEAGLGEDARAELETVRSQVRGADDRLRFAALLQQSGAYHAAGRLLIDAHQHELSRGPKAGQGIALWRRVWPLAFEREVEAAVAASGIARELLYAVMREESHYRPRVVSVVGARGLAQIMPATGRGLAQQLGARHFDPDELFEPARNLLLAAHYLAQLQTRFEGRDAAVIAAYNAGETAVTGWLARAAALEDDEWVEAIPYAQTRGYVKRVLRSVHAYRLLYPPPSEHATGRGL